MEWFKIPNLESLVLHGIVKTDCGTECVPGQAQAEKNTYHCFVSLALMAICIRAARRPYCNLQLIVLSILKRNVGIRFKAVEVDRRRLSPEINKAMAELFEAPCVIVDTIKEEAQVVHLFTSFPPKSFNFW